MMLTASLTLMALLGSLLLTGLELGSPLAVAHLAFAVGIVPLIMAAMIHFVPVLTRTGDPAPGIARLPHWAQLSGLLAVAAMQSLVPYGCLRLAAAADLLLVVILLQWIVRRAGRALGMPHPGWRWYGAALACLILALLAILFQPIWPDAWRPLRLFHLHLNTLGLVGLAAFGTLPVLMPTVVGQADSQAGAWLRRRLWLVAGGVVSVATGAAITWLLAAPGAALIFVAAFGLCGQWLRSFGLRKLLRDGAACSLLAASLGWLLMVFAGVLHGSALLSPLQALPAWISGFLLPLVTGALSQLLPVWRFPGPNTPERQTMRARLVRMGGWRAAAFLLAGQLWLLDLSDWARLFTAMAMAAFVLDFLRAMCVRPASR